MRENHPDPAQIEEHVRETYLAHLPGRLALLRELFSERQWRRLKIECEKLALGAEKHGLNDLAVKARASVERIPADVDSLMSYSLDDESRIALGVLFQAAGASHH